MTPNKNITAMYLEAMDILNELNIEVGQITTVTWNKRFKAVWGRCYYNEKADIYKIELNSILSIPEVSWTAAMNTMIHEVLHAHKDRFNHGKEWQKCADLVNRNYNIYHIATVTSAEEKGIADRMKPTYKYVVTCVKCGARCKYQKAGKVIKLIKSRPGSCRCGGCGSTDLIVTEC